MVYSVHNAAPFFTEPDAAGTSQLAAGKNPRPKRLTNAWQEEWYTELPATQEGVDQQKAADVSNFRSVYQHQHTDEPGRRAHAAEDEAAAASALAENIEDVREPAPLRKVWERDGAGSKVTLNAEGGANRGRVLLLRDDKAEPRAAMRARAAEAGRAPWTRGGEKGDAAGLAQAWASAAGAAAGGQQAEVAGRGWRYIARNAEGSAGPKGLSSESRGGKDLDGSGLASRGAISHVGDHIEADVGVTERRDFGWGFVTTTGEGARPDGPREGFQARLARKKAAATVVADGGRTVHSDALQKAEEDMKRQEAEAEGEERTAGKASGVARPQDRALLSLQASAFFSAVAEVTACALCRAGWDAHRRRRDAAKGAVQIHGAREEAQRGGGGQTRPVCGPHTPDSDDRRVGGIDEAPSQQRQRARGQTGALGQAHPDDGGPLESQTKNRLQAAAPEAKQAQVALPGGETARLEAAGAQSES